MRLPISKKIRFEVFKRDSFTCQYCGANLQLGVRFGKLTSIAFFQQPEKNRYVWRVLCICDCGRMKDYRVRDLHRGRKTHCGCLPNRGQFEKKHGHCSNGIRSRAWKSWRSMHRRCTQTYNKDIFKTYGARGIKVCERWAKFENFLADMGEPPEGMTLDRWPNNTGNYEPENCRWATQSQQARNRRTNVFLTYEGETLTLAEWVIRKNLSRGRVFHRLAKGWSVERAFNEPKMTKAQCGILGSISRGLIKHA